MTDIPWLMAGLLAVSGAFSGSEAALFTLGSRGADRAPQWVRPLLDDSVASLTVILCSNLVVNLAYFALAAGWARQLESGSAAVVQFTAVLAIVLGGEILPKTIAHRYPDYSGRVLLPPVLVLHRLFARPARWLGLRWVRPRPLKPPLDSEHLSDILAAQERSILGEKEHGLLNHLLELGTLRAGAIRLPLHKVAKLNELMPLRDANAELRKKKVAWAAVQDARGEVIGILDLCRQPRGRLVRDGMRPVPILPELAPVAAGVPLLRKSGAPFVLLVDEHGTGSGIIERGRWADTLIDRLPEANRQGYGPAVMALGGQRFLVDAGLPLHDFRDHFGDPGTCDPLTETLLGFIEERLGRLACLNDSFCFSSPANHFEVRVVRCEGQHPVRLELRLQSFSPEVSPDP
jgi:magnesium and cobalt exporter, CNNM family